jgi:hypothetical protein
MKSIATCIGSIFILFFISIPTFAQFNLGVKAGINMGDIKVRSKTLLVEEQYAPLRLWHLGVLGTMDFNPRLGAQIEIIYNQKGGQSPIDLAMANPIEAFWQYKLSYLSLPLSFQYKVGPISLEAGPEIGYLIHLKTLRNNIPVDNKHSIFGQTKVDFSLNAGFKFSVRKIFTEVRWSRSLMPIGENMYTDVNGEDIGSYRYYSNTLEVSLGYLFGSAKNDKAEDLKE